MPPARHVQVTHLRGLPANGDADGIRRSCRQETKQVKAQKTIAGQFHKCILRRFTAIIAGRITVSMINTGENATLAGKCVVFNRFPGAIEIDVPSSVPVTVSGLKARPGQGVGASTSTPGSGYVQSIQKPPVRGVFSQP